MACSAISLSVRRFLAAALLTLPLAAAAVEPLRLPPPIQFPQPVDSARVSAALLAACTRQKWIVEKDTGEVVTAYRQQRNLRLHISIAYDPKGIAYEYLDSDNFYGQDDEKGGVLIHRRANAWLEALGDEVMLQLQPILFGREPALVVPVDPAPAPAATPPGGADKPPG